LIDADGRVHQSSAGESKALVVAGQGQVSREVGRGIADVADGIALREFVVDAVAIGIDLVAVERG
jgi:hypothetical protein